MTVDRRAESPASWVLILGRPVDANAPFQFRKGAFDDFGGDTQAVVRYRDEVRS